MNELDGFRATYIKWGNATELFPKVRSLYRFIAEYNLKLLCSRVQRISLQEIRLRLYETTFKKNRFAESGTRMRWTVLHSSRASTTWRPWPIQNPIFHAYISVVLVRPISATNDRELALLQPSCFMLMQQCFTAILNWSGFVPWNSYWLPVDSNETIHRWIDKRLWKKLVYQNERGLKHTSFVMKL